MPENGSADGVALAPPLSGMRVLELAGKGPTPQAAMMLADMGADVIRIDRARVKAVTGGPDPRRGRRSIVLDLKDDRARDVLLRLLRSADALIEGYRPGVTDRLGIGPKVCLAANPALIYVRASGWGQTGPLSRVAGHDINYIALTGALHVVGPHHGAPVIPANFVGDGAGGMLAAFGLVCGVFQARQTGQGQVVDAAMLDAAAGLMALFQLRTQTGEWIDERGANKIDGGYPVYGVYETADGQYVSIGSLEPAFFDALLERTGLSWTDLGDRWDTACWDAQRAALAALFRTRTRAEWTEILEGSEACFSPVLSIAEAPAHPHNRERGTFIEVDGLTQPAPAPRFSRSDTTVRRGAAVPGAHTDEILAEVGLTAEKIDELVASGAVRRGTDSTDGGTARGRVPRASAAR